MTLTLHDYQRQAVDFLRDRNRAGLLLQMGLGKTCISLSALEPRHLPALVIAPKRVAENVWDKEASLWRPDLSVTLAVGGPAKRKTALESEADVVVIGRDNIKDVLAHSGKFKTIIIDELSGFKNRGSIRWKVGKKICADVPHVWGLTGTPAPNGLMDLWAQIYLLDNGARLGKAITHFRDRYYTPGRQLANGVVTEWLLRPGADKRIHALIEDICLSMETEGRIKLPPVTENTVEVELEPKVRRLYKELKRDLVADLEIIGGETHYAQNAAVLTSKLSQVAAGFMYHDDADLRGGTYDIIHWEKAKAVEEIVDGTGSPVLVFYRFRAELEMLQKTLGSRAHTMDTDNVVDRWNSGNIPVLLAHPASAGHGLNLQHGGHTVVWSTLPWSLEEYLQANKRLDRQGQKHPVVIHQIIAPKTVDIAVRASLQDKDATQSALLAHLESPL